MRFATKLAIALWIGITLIYLANGVDRFRREAALFEADMQRDHIVMGRGLASAVAEVWEAEGKDAALVIVAGTNQRENDVTIRWVYLDAPVGDSFAPVAPRDALSGVAEGKMASWEDREGDGRLVAYVPLHVHDHWTGAIEISESLAAERAYLNASMWRVGMVTVALVFVSGGIAMALGVWFVGRPIRLLVEKARRVGESDFSGDLTLRQNDELGELAREMNAMAGRLEETRTRLDAESTARIAALEQLRHGERVMTVGKLASGVAHEIGTPLHVIAHRAKMIAVGRAEGDQARDNARIVQEQTERIARIVRQLLDYARRGRVETRVQDVGPLVDRSLVLLEPLARKQRVDLQREMPDVPVYASLDGPQMQQVVTNLVMNAVQAMPEGGRLAVRVSRARRPGPPDVPPSEAWVRVTVEDTGTGIDPTHLPLIFDPFFTTKDVGEGTGLGLSVAWGIVREHRGFIEVASAPGEGTRFDVYVPEAG